MTPETTIAPSLDTILHDRLHVTREAIEAFCRKWNIVELSLFGWVLQEDFRDDDAIEVLVVYAKDATWHGFGWVEMLMEFDEMVGRTVAWFAKGKIKNPCRRDRALKTQRLIYARDLSPSD